MVNTIRQARFPPGWVFYSMPMHKPKKAAPEEPAQFFGWLKQETETYWKDAKLKDDIYGFQIQAGTRWNEGLSDAEIASFEKKMGFAFPPIYKLYLKSMNGTDKETINIYGRSGEPVRYGTGFYAYPRDLAKVREMIAWIYESCHVTPADVEAREIPHIMPIVAHRFLVMDRCASNPVLSMYGDDIIPYGTDLMDFLRPFVISDVPQDPARLNDIRVRFWLEID